MSGDDPPVTIQELRKRMRQLHEECGAPTAAGMRKAIMEFTVPRLAPASLSEFFSNKRPNALPRQDFLRGFVAACLLSYGVAPGAVTERLATWDMWWTGLVLASGAPPITIAPAPPPFVDKKPTGRRYRPISVIIGVCAGLAAGAAAALAISPLVDPQDPRPQWASVEVGPSTRPAVGSECPSWETTIRNDRNEPMGAMWYRECVNRLEVVITDNLPDNFCIFAIILWSNGQGDSTERICQAGHINHDEFARQSPDFRVELVAVDSDAVGGR